MQNNYRRTKTISITSGKGGVGKTTLVSNMAFALAQKGHRVLIFDGDLGMSNVDLFYGVKSNGNLLEVLQGQKDMNEIVTSLGPRIDLISGGSGCVELNRMSAFERRTLLDSVQSFDQIYDFMLIDTAPGISDNVLYLNSAAQKIVVVINSDPSSISDSYALIKVLNQEYKESRFSIVCNQVRDELDGFHLFNRFNEVVSRFLYVGLDYMGSISQDALFRKSTQHQRLILKHEPLSLPAKQILGVSDRIEKEAVKLSDKSGLQFFWDQVVGVA